MRSSLQHGFVFKTAKSSTSSPSGSVEAPTTKSTATSPSTAAAHNMTLLDLLRWLSNCSTLMSASRATAEASAAKDAAMLGGSRMLSARRPVSPASSDPMSSNADGHFGMFGVEPARPFATLEAVSTGAVSVASVGIVLHSQSDDYEYAASAGSGPMLLNRSHPLYGKLCSDHLYSLLTKRHKQVWGGDSCATHFSATQAKGRDFVGFISFAQEVMLSYVAKILYHVCFESEQGDKRGAHNQTAPIVSDLLRVCSLGSKDTPSASIVDAVLIPHLSDAVMQSPSPPPTSSGMDPRFVAMLIESGASCTTTKGNCVIDEWTRCLQPT